MEAENRITSFEKTVQYDDGDASGNDTGTAKHPDHPPRLWRGVLLTAVCTLSIVLVSATMSSSLISLPVIGNDLGIREDQLQWITSAYALSSTYMGDEKSSSLAVSFKEHSPWDADLITLAVLRGFQGLGAAATIPASLGILAYAFPPGNARSLAFATFSAGQPLGGGLGSAVGGLLTQFAAPSWRTMFYVIAGLSVICIIGAFALIERDPLSTEKDKRVDWIGVALITSGLILIVFVLSDGEVAPKQWKTPYIIALLVVGVILSAMFLVWQWYLERLYTLDEPPKWVTPPLMKLSLWRRGNGRFAAMQAIVFFLMCAFQSWQLWAVLYYQNYKGYSPVLTMLRVLPTVPTGILCNVLIGLVIERIPGVVLIAIGCLCTAVSGLLFAVINPNATYWAFGFPSAVITVFGADFVFAAGSLFIAKLALPHEQSLAGGLFQTMAQLGTSFGLATTTIVFDRVRAQQGKRLGIDVDPQGLNAPPEAQLRAYRAAEWTIFAFGAFACLLAVLFLRGVGVVGGPHKPPTSGDFKSDSEHTVAIDSAP
ncbi:efflux transporter [Panus rudis PR-1116 ss-1]|nr:efflux transporter [Panus rudis PR-1116 ss-1]